jgi:hypothetical protein
LWHFDAGDHALTGVKQMSGRFFDGVNRRPEKRQFAVNHLSSAEMREIQGGLSGQHSGLW